jgi:hypothetical protein
MKLTGKTENKTTIFEKIKQIDKMIWFSAVQKENW